MTLRYYGKQVTDQRDSVWTSSETPGVLLPVSSDYCRTRSHKVHSVWFLFFRHEFLRSYFLCLRKEERGRTDVSSVNFFSVSIR